MAKGGQFERDFCTDLSKWWTHGVRDDIFWRTAGSGGRATVRGKRGRSTFGQHGDILFTDPSGASLLDLITFELKRGYNKDSPIDLCDRLDVTSGQKNQTQWEEWLEQAERSHLAAGSYSWMIVQRRDHRIPFCYFPCPLMNLIHDYCTNFTRPMFDWPCLKMRCEWRRKDKSRKVETLYGTSLANFFRQVDPEEVKRIVKSC